MSWYAQKHAEPTKWRGKEKIQIHQVIGYKWIKTKFSEKFDKKLSHEHTNTNVGSPGSREWEIAAMREYWATLNQIPNIYHRNGDGGSIVNSNTLPAHIKVGIQLVTC